MCKQHALNNEGEWGLLEFWDTPGINGLLSERKLPADELLLDQTLLTWEQAARKRYGLVNSVPRLPICPYPWPSHPDTLTLTPTP